MVLSHSLAQARETTMGDGIEPWRIGAFLERFIPEVPNAYYQERVASREQRAWVMLWYVTLIYGAFYGLDVILYPHHAYRFGLMRLGCVCLALCGLAAGRRSPRARVGLAILCLCLCAFSISTMCVYTGGFGSNYLVGIVLCLVGGSTIEILPPLGFFCVGLLILAYHLLANSLFGKDTTRGEIAWAVFMLAGAIVLCSIGALLIDEQRRRLFLAKHSLNEKNRELETKHHELLESNRQADRIFAALAEALEGTVLDDRYRLEERIGQGGFGTVFRATRLADGSQLAIKVFRPQPGNGSLMALKRFREEGVSGSRVNHRNAVNIFDSGVSAEGIAYIVMELLEGRSLSTELRLFGKLPAMRSCEIARAVSEALAEAHRVGIIHRDIKPDNIFLHRMGEHEIVKVVDFGAAKLQEGEDGQTVTATGIIGTPVYMAPEQLDEGMCTGRSDVYSLSVVLYEMLCGRRPFTSTDGGVWSVAKQHLSKLPQPPCALDPTIPSAVASLCLRGLAKRYEERPSAEQLAAELTAILAEMARRTH